MLYSKASPLVVNHASEEYKAWTSQSTTLSHHPCYPSLNLTSLKTLNPLTSGSHVVVPVGVVVVDHVVIHSPNLPIVVVDLDRTPTLQSLQLDLLSNLRW